MRTQGEKCFASSELQHVRQALRTAEEEKSTLVAQLAHQHQSHIQSLQVMKVTCKTVTRLPSWQSSMILSSQLSVYALLVELPQFL